MRILVNGFIRMKRIYTRMKPPRLIQEKRLPLKLVEVKIKINQNPCVKEGLKKKRR